MASPSFWEPRSVALGAAFGTATTAAVFLTTQETTTLQMVVAIALCVVSVLFGFVVVRQAGAGWSILGFLVAALLAAPSAHKLFKWLEPDPELRLARVELPGFSVDVLGAEIDRFTTEYDFGWIRTRDRYFSLSTTVLWREGTLAADADSVEHAVSWVTSFEYEDPITGGPGEEMVTWPGGDARTFKIFIGLRRSDATLIACGKRLIAVLTEGSPRSDVVHAHRRIVSTIACSPIAEEEVGVGAPPPVAISLPEPWEENPDVDPLWKVWSTDSASMIFLYYLRGHKNAGELKPMVTDSIGHWGTVAETGVEFVDGLEVWRGTLTDDAGTDEVLAFWTKCERRPMLAVLFGNDGLEEVRAAFFAARCE